MGLGSSPLEHIVTSMKPLTEADVLKIMREEWDKKVSTLSEAIDMVMTAKTDGKQKLVVTPELKVRHKKSQIRYTVSSVGPRDVILRTPEGDEFIVDATELERDYELD